MQYPWERDWEPREADVPTGQVTHVLSLNTKTTPRRETYNVRTRVHQRSRRWPDVERLGPLLASRLSPRQCEETRLTSSHPRKPAACNNRSTFSNALSICSFHSIPARLPCSSQPPWPEHFTTLPGRKTACGSASLLFLQDARASLLPQLVAV
jgi:hypothetical protein